MSNRYNIVWIDDQFEEMGGFIDEADQACFDVTAFASSREGMEYLESNVSAVDALILDAKVFRDGPEDMASEKGLSASIREIARISGKNRGKDIPYVVFTGQPDLQSNEDFAERMDGVPIFSKTQDTQTMFDKLRELIGASPDASVRNQYRATYHACTKGGIDPQCWKLLAPVLRSITHVENLPTDPYNDVRKALEWIFRYLHRHCVIHEKLIDDGGRVNVRSTSHFLAGNRAKVNSATGEHVQANRAIMPKLLTDCVKFIVDTTHTGSHTEEPEDAEDDIPSIEAINEFCPKHHIVQLVAIMTADVAEWAANYVAAHPNADENRGCWVDSTTSISADGNVQVECVIISENHAAFFGKPSSPTPTSGQNVRIPKDLVDFNLSRNDRVHVTAHKHDIRADHWLATSVEII